MAIARRFEVVGKIYPGYHTFEAGGLRIARMHEPKSIDALVASGFDILSNTAANATGMDTEPNPFAQSLIAP